MKKNKTPKQTDNRLSETRTYVVMVFSIILGICVGFWLDDGDDDKVKEVGVTNMYTNDTHYVIVEGKDGSVAIVNYTLDSLKQESVSPQMKIEIVPNGQEGWGEQPKESQ